MHYIEFMLEPFSGRYRHEIAFDKGNIFVFGGGSSVEVFALDTIPVFNVITKKWTRVKTDPGNYIYFKI